MNVELTALPVLPRPAREAVRVPRVQGALPAYDGAGSGWRIDDRSAGKAIVRFWHRALSARAVALSASGWALPDPPDACDLEPAGDGWWTAAFRVPDDWQATYEMVEHDGDGPPPWHIDGLHRGPRVVAGRKDLDRVLVPSAVRLVQGRAWATPEENAHTDEIVTLNPRSKTDPRVRLWRSPGCPAPVPLVVLFDGEAHVDRLDTPAVVRAAQRAGVIPDLALAFVDAGPRRADVLGLPTGQSEWVATRLVPRLLADGALGAIDGRAIVSGSSFGGLSSLFSLAHSRGTIGAVIAQSPSFWRFPGDALDDALTDTCRGAGARVRLHAGRYEGSGPARSVELARRLAETGSDASARVITGGHDWTWWVPEAIEEIGDLLQSW